MAAAGQHDCDLSARARLQYRSALRVRLCRWLVVLAIACVSCRSTGDQIVKLPVKHSVQSEQFLVLSDVRLDNSHALIADLVKLRANVSETLDLPVSARSVNVYLFGTEEVYHRYLQQTYPGLPPRRAYFVGTPRELAVYTFWGERIQEDLRHEFTHGLLHSCLTGVPLWLDEGLAEYFEVIGPAPGQINPEYARQLSAAIVNGWRPDLKRLERLEQVQQMQRADYREAWAWVHFMLHGDPDAPDVLRSYVNDLRKTARPHPLSSRLHEVQPAYEQRLLSYIASLNTFGVATTSGRPLPDQPDEAKRLTAQQNR